MNHTAVMDDNIFHLVDLGCTFRVLLQGRIDEGNLVLSRLPKVGISMIILEFHDHNLTLGDRLEVNNLASLSQRGVKFTAIVCTDQDKRKPTQTGEAIRLMHYVPDSVGAYKPPPLSRISGMKSNL